MKIKNLDDMYNILEEIDFSNYRSVKKLIKNYLYSKNEDESGKILCEYNCLGFRIIKSELKGIISTEDDDGEVVQFPNLDQFKPKDFDYINYRITQTENNLLKFRYYSIICNKFPHFETAKMCVNLSWNLINDLEKRISTQNFREVGDFINIILNSYAFSFKFNIGIERIKNKILKLISNVELWNKEYYIIPYSLINHILDEKKNFKDLTGLDEICWNIALNLKKEDVNPHSVIMFLELGEKLDFKLQNNVHNWRNEIGKIYEEMCTESENGSGSLLCISAIENYKKAGNKIKVEALLEEYHSKYSKNLNFNEVSLKLEDYNKSLHLINEIASDLVENHDSEFILKYLTGDPKLRNAYKSSLNFVDVSKEEFLLLYMLPTVLFNPEGFIFERFTNIDEKDKYVAINYYSFYMDLIYLPFLSRVINLSIIRGKLSSEILIDFITKNSWLGLKEIPILGENKFLSMIIPSINIFFDEWELLCLHNYDYPHFVLTIDSLISKIEGIIKLIYNLDNSIKEPTGHGTLLDKSLNTILEDSNFDILPKEDLFFLRFLLIEKSGLNLRNNVAHCLMGKMDYNEHNANLLILSLLKLCSFKLVFEGDK